MNADLRPEIDLLRDWILKNSPKIQSVEDDDDLIESRALDSLAFMRFVYFIEEVFDREVVLDESVAQNFRTLAAVCRHFKSDKNDFEARNA
jgi:acyl carrier protein